MSECPHIPPGITPCPWCEIERLRKSFHDLAELNGIEIERLNAQALDLACEISKARRERDEARASRDLWRKRAEVLGWPTEADRDAALAADQPPPVVTVPCAIEDCPKCSDPETCTANGKCRDWHEFVTADKSTARLE